MIEKGLLFPGKYWHLARNCFIWRLKELSKSHRLSTPIIYKWSCDNYSRENSFVPNFREKIMFGLTHKQCRVKVKSVNPKLLRTLRNSSSLIWGALWASWSSTLILFSVEAYWKVIFKNGRRFVTSGEIRSFNSIFSFRNFSSMSDSHAEASYLISAISTLRQNIWIVPKYEQVELLLKI